VKQKGKTAEIVKIIPFAPDNPGATLVMLGSEVFMAP
jgi:hypothetical protein